MKPLTKPSAVEAYTVPSQSRHQDMIETIESYCNRLIAEIQLEAHDNIQRLYDLEKNTVYDDVNHQLAVALAIDKKIREIFKEEKKKIQDVIAQKQQIMSAFLDWEKSNPED